MCESPEIQLVPHRSGDTGIAEEYVIHQHTHMYHMHTYIHTHTHTYTHIVYTNNTFAMTGLKSGSHLELSLSLTKCLFIFFPLLSAHVKYSSYCSYPFSNLYFSSKYTERSQLVRISMEPNNTYPFTFSPAFPPTFSLKLNRPN
ncbi:hypothetical protein CLIB1423_03S05270 [[Candida] railenensis]|uniref:Uncharacterized protein n=1 Tax=[Candida] railenensis TaxID=45579 RepID=A0A9P0QME5_9ASCO|nr:hypothetical protein CLIB1423_03S05270 [[Candida] railenensis]